MTRWQGLVHPAVMRRTTGARVRDAQAGLMDRHVQGRESRFSAGHHCHTLRFPLPTPSSRRTLRGSGVVAFGLGRVLPCGAAALAPAAGTPILLAFAPGAPILLAPAAGAPILLAGGMTVLEGREAGVERVFAAVEVEVEVLVVVEVVVVVAGRAGGV